MQVTAILLRWYRSFNVRALGPADETPREPWHTFRGATYPFVHVPLDRLITTIVGANESGKSHLLSAIAKVVTGEARLGRSVDRYEIKDICRYCGLGGLDESVWPEIGVEVRVDANEVRLFGGPVGEAASDAMHDDGGGGHATLTIILNGHADATYATVYRDSTLLRTLSRSGWAAFAAAHLPVVEVLNADLALPNEVHIDELIDLYERQAPKRVVDALAVQELWRELEPIQIVQGTGLDQAAAGRVHDLKTRLSTSTREPITSEGELVLKLFSGILGITLENLRRFRRYSSTDRGYVTWLNDEVDAQIDRELDISRYWDQDEDFRLTVDYKAGTFHFQITDRTTATYTFNERSSGLR
jgi:hypothetical protein